MSEIKLSFLPEKFDVIFFDNVGTPYIGSTPRFSGLGGSEFQTIVLAEGLAKSGLNVMCVNSIPYPAMENGVFYLPADSLNIQSFKTKVLITLRSSQLPNQYVQYDKHLIWVTDLNGPHYDIVRELCQGNPAITLVAVSKWHMDQFPEIQNKTYIYNQIPDQVYDLKVKKNKDQVKLIYASAAAKGLPQTIEYFKHLKKDYFFKKSDLVVLSPGYDVPSKELLANKITYKGALSFYKTLQEIGSSTAMLYVNVMPETFGISPLLSEILDTPPFVLTAQPGALKEILNSPFISNDAEALQKDLISYIKNGKYHCQPKDFRSSTIMPKWHSLLGF